jgi:ketosteroid isomerase-like protein
MINVMTLQTTQNALRWGYRTAILLLLVFAGSASALRAQAHEHGAMHAADSTDVVQAAKRFTEALATGDSTTIAAMLLPEAVILEGGGVEDRHHYLEHHYPSDVRFLQAMAREPKSRQAHMVGDVAYVASTSRLHGTYRDRDVDLSSAELMVLRKTAEGWKVAAIHWSSRSNE